MECESGTIIPIVQTQGVSYTSIKLQNNNLGQSTMLMVFCAGVTGGSWLPSEGVVSHFTLRLGDRGHQKHHTTSRRANCVHQTLLKLHEFILLCCVQL